MTMFELLKALKEKHKLLDKNVKLLEKSRVTDRSDETWEALGELKKDKLAVKDEIERMNKNFNGKSYVNNGIESDF